MDGQSTPTPQRVLQLLAAVEAPAGLLAEWRDQSWVLTSFPDATRWRQEGIDSLPVADALPGWLDGSATPMRQVVTLSRVTRFAGLLTRRIDRRLLVFRLDEDRTPHALLLVPVESRLAGRGRRSPFDFRELLATPVGTDAPRASEVPAPLVRSWESLAEALHHGVLICDPELILRYHNPSGAELLGLGHYEGALGRSLLTFGWDNATRELLQRYQLHPFAFRQKAQHQRDGRTVDLVLAGRPLEGRGLVVECLYEEQSRERASSLDARLAHFRDVAGPPPSTSSVSIPLTWSGPLATQPLPAPGRLALHRQWATGQGFQTVAWMSHPETSDTWTAWAQGVLDRIGHRLRPLATLPEILSQVAREELLTPSGTFAGTLALGRMQPDFRSFEWGILGPGGILQSRHVNEAWTVAHPDHILFLGHGCPVLHLYRGDLLPGEALWTGAWDAVKTEDQALIEWLNHWPGSFPATSWRSIRGALGLGDPEAGTTPAGLNGGVLIRLSAGVREERVLYPQDFRLFCNTLQMRLKGRGAEDHSSFQIRVALDEVLTNAFVHGHQGDPGQAIRVTTLLEEGCLHVTVADQGTGFDPLQLRDPTMPEAILESGGRGVYIANQMMDDVRFGLRTNEIALTKYFATPREQEFAAPPFVPATSQAPPES
ncbi:MAG: ATP-binding protein [bacterium]